MIFLELALFGFKNFKSLTRFTFKPGLNVVEGENGAGKTAIQEAIFLTLAPEENVPLHHLRRPDTKTDCQAGLVMKLNDGRVVRIVRDFSGEKIGLAELDAERKFQVKMTSPAEIGVFLSEQIGGIPSPSLRNLFLITQLNMPSSRPAFSKNGRSNGFHAGEITPDTPLPGTKEYADKEKRVAELKSLLEEADRLAKLEDDLANTQSQRAEVSRRVRIVKEKAEEIHSLDQQYSDSSKIKDLPEDYNAVLEAAVEQEQTMGETIGSLTEELEYARQDMEAISGEPFYLNKLFIGGGAASLISILTVIIVELSPLIQNLLMIPLLAGIGLMGFVGFGDFVKSNKRRKLDEKIRAVERKMKRTELEFKKENSKVIELLTLTESRDIPALKEKVSEYERYMEQRRLKESEQTQQLEGKSLEDIQKSFDEINGRIAEIEAEIKKAATLPSDIYLMQEELRTLEKQLSGTKETEKTVEAAPPDSAEPVPANGGADLLSAPLKEGLNISPVRAHLFGKLPESLNRIRRIVENIGGPLDNRLELTESLTPELSTPDKKPLPWNSISAGQRDLFHLATQLGLIEILGSAYSFPLVMDNPLNALDPRRQQAALDILREISQNRQIIFLSSLSFPEKAGTNQIKLR